MLACALHSLAEQRRRTRPQQLTQWHSSTVAPGKSVRTKRQLQPCKSQPTRNPLHREHVGPHAHRQWHYRWFHRRTPGGNIGFQPRGNKKHQPLALYLFEIDCAPSTKSLQHEQLLSSLISSFYTLADSELIPSTTQPHWTNINVKTVEPLEK